jgi:calcineurin-like phosphoesterase family protein
MNRALVALWNGVVTDRDDIFLLGDFGYSRQDLESLGSIFVRLRGRKHLIIGNHDEKNPHCLRAPWLSREHLLEVKENGVRAVLCHYPLETWAGAHRGVLMLHGHSHGTLKRSIPHRFDVGVECFPQPVALAVLAKVAAKQTFAAVDHHGSDA